MIDLGVALKAVGGARTGIMPASLLDVLDVNGNSYFWSDRPVNAPMALASVVEASGPPGTPGFLLTPPVALSTGQQAIWSVPTTGAVEGLASYTIDGSASHGEVDMAFQGPFTNPNRLTFSDFTPNTLPAGAIVDACYMVINYELFGKAPFSTIPFPFVDGSAGQASALVAFPSPLEAFFSYYDTVPPTGPDEQHCIIHSIAAYIIYHFESEGGGGGGSLPFGKGSVSAGPYLPWIVSVPKITFNRSLQADFGEFVLQNLSGDVLTRDFERIRTRSALEGALFIYRLWQPDVRSSWMEMHGSLSVSEVGVDTVKLKGMQLLSPAQDDTPHFEYSETCQLKWAGRRCGATGTTECQYSYQSCQVPERILVALNDYEKNYGEALANVPINTINRRRKI